uniref:Uncharacterized protein n=1 Tax=Candidatus Kentrum sp. FW TaxID=2126338 RepID=A0A450TAG6_9GAMM|nr:MAG: hypothetical protein BECKFW1821B_GA0114236_10867 [Candidatus Kentron sp. FW]
MDESFGAAFFLWAVHTTRRKKVAPKDSSTSTQETKEGQISDSAPYTLILKMMERQQPSIRKKNEEQFLQEHQIKAHNHAAIMGIEMVAKIVKAAECWEIGRQRSDVLEIGDRGEVSAVCGN